MTDNRIKKIRAEIERLYNQSLADENRQADRGLERAASVSYGKSKACKELLFFIDSLQEEPVSEDLEKAANQWDVKASFTPFYMTLDGNGKPNGVKQDYTTHAESFKAGANWQKEQIMENAIECEITWMDGFMLNYTQEQQDDLLEKIGAKVGDKVKLVIIKKN